MQIVPLYSMLLLNQMGWQRWSIQKSVSSLICGTAKDSNKQSLCFLSSSLCTALLLSFCGSELFVFAENYTSEITEKHSAQLISEQQMSLETSSSCTVLAQIAGVDLLPH